MENVLGHSEKWKVGMGGGWLVPSAYCCTKQE